MCHSRLAEGEAPACAEACPTHAIRIVTVKTDTERRHRKADTENRQEELPSHTLPSFPLPPSPASCPPSPVSGFLPATADPAYTQPTTRYVTRRDLPNNLIAGDADALRVQLPHWPLVVMLTLIPCAVGLSLLAAATSRWPSTAMFGALISAPTPPAEFSRNLTGAAAWIGAAGLAASVLHLGRPLRAWRIFLGWRRSWLSREALLFGVWGPLMAASLLFPRLLGAAAVIGVAGLACSAMIYIDTRRLFWRATQTVPRFFGTAALVPLAIVAPSAAAIGLMAKVGWETRTFFGRTISSRLQRGPLGSAVACRDLLAITATFLLLTSPGSTAVAILIAGELAERYIFFRAVDAPKMPGVAA